MCYILEQSLGISRCMGTIKKYKLSILAFVLALILLYIIQNYMEHSVLKFILWILVPLIEVYIIQFERRLNKKII